MKFDYFNLKLFHHLAYFTMSTCDSRLTDCHSSFCSGSIACSVCVLEVRCTVFYMLRLVYNSYVSSGILNIRIS